MTLRVKLSADNAELNADFGEVVRVERVDAVRTTPQELTEGQKDQARKNIDTLKVVTVKYWNNGGVDDAKELFWAAIHANGNGLFVCYAEDENFPYPAPLRMYDCWADTAAAGCTVQASNGIEYRCDMSPDGLEIIDRLDRYITEVNGQGGSVKTAWYATVTEKADGSYSCDRNSTACHNAQVDGYSVYAMLGDEIAPLSVMDGWRRAEFALPLIYSDGFAVQRMIILEGSAVTIEAIRLVEEKFVQYAAKNFAACDPAQNLRTEQLIGLAVNTTLRLPVEFVLCGDGSAGLPFELRTLVAKEELCGEDTFQVLPEMVAMWMEGIAVVEMRWERYPGSNEWQILHCERFEPIGDGAAWYFSNGSWRVTLTDTTDADGNMAWTITAEAIPELPPVTTEDAGKVLVAGADSLPRWESAQGSSGVWKLHTELTLAEDVTCWEIDLPAAWRKLCILTKEGSLPICRDASGNKTTYQITASTAEKLNVDGSSHFAYMRNDRVWCLVDRMGENNYTAITSSYTARGNSGYSPATAAAKIESTLGVDFHHIVVHGWGTGSDKVISAGTQIKILYLE